MAVPAFKYVQKDCTKANFTLFTSICKGCGLCMEKCPVKCLEWSNELGVYGTPTVIPKDQDSCTGCGTCALVCPDCAITIERKKLK
ncbi:MAG: 4Fe-4S binding protein [Clostridia bacterium]|jgi:2-oxoglutarate ferredoxin oxidoreductase subunit delta|nr:4Fe-4S binding protein [Clostridia bacterium]